MVVNATFVTKWDLNGSILIFIHGSAPLYYLRLLYCFTTLKGFILWCFALSLNEELKYFPRCSSRDPWGSMPAFGSPY